MTPDRHSARDAANESSRPPRVSACLVVRNEEAVIRRCLQSLLPVADEIILVHDGPPADRTVTIAESLGCRVFVRDPVGDPEFHTVFAYEEARGEWILSIDADEFLSEEMAAIVPSLLGDTGHDGWSFFWPMWDGARYITTTGPFKPALFRRSALSLVGHLQSSETVTGAVGQRREQLHHQPLYNNFTPRSVIRKYRPWCQVHALELVRPFAELPTFNYHGPDRWPRRRRVLNVLSPLLAIPNGLIHFGLSWRAGPGERPAVRLRLALYQGLYATILQLYVARYMYIDRAPRR